MLLLLLWQRITLECVLQCVAAPWPLRRRLGCCADVGGGMWVVGDVEMQKGA